MNDSSTPLTDAEAIGSCGIHSPEMVRSVFARQLERELAVERAKYKLACEAFDKEISAVTSELSAWHSQFGAQLSQAVEEFDQQCKELDASKSELEQFRKREREFPTHHSQDISPELKTW